MPSVTHLFNPVVTDFIDTLNLPLRKEVEAIRETIFLANDKVEEIIKWNGPNYTFNGQDRITMRVQPPKFIQLIFHRGARVLEQPSQKLIADDEGLLDWKTNDRAVATFKTMDEIQLKKKALTTIIRDWLRINS